MRSAEEKKFKAEPGQRVYVKIVDDECDGGSIIMVGWDTVCNVNSLGNYELLHSGLIAKPKEILRTAKKKEF